MDTVNSDSFIEVSTHWIVRYSFFSHFDAEASSVDTSDKVVVFAGKDFKSHKTETTFDCALYVYPPKFNAEGDKSISIG